MTQLKQAVRCCFGRRGKRIAKPLCICVSFTFLSLISAAGLAADLTNELWEATYDGGYGDDWVYGLDIDSQGNVVAAGCITGPPGYYKTAYLFKYPADGGTPWIDTMEMGPVGGDKHDSNDVFYHAAVDSEDNIIVVGQKSGTWTGDSIGSYHLVAVVRKYSPDGTLTWERTYQDGAQSTFNMARGVCVDTNDNIFVAAQVFTSQEIDYQWALLKYDKDGNLQSGFPVYYDFLSNWDYPDAPYDIAVDKDGNFIAVGIRGVTNDNLDWHVRKYDSSRTLVWEDTYDGANLYEHALGVDVDSNGDVFVAGWTNLGTDNGANGNSDWLIIKYRAADGYRLWTRTFESEEGRIEGCRDLAVDGLDNVLVGGYIGMADGSARWRLERLNGADGSLLAEEVWESEDSSGIHALAFRDRRVALGGYECDPTDRHMRIALAAVPPPEITLLGENPVTLEVGTAYIEPGFTALDDFEGDLTGEVVVTGSVDHTVVGTYELHYNVLASNIDPAEEKVRTVNVVDSISPEITLLGANPMTLEVMIPYTDPGYTATDNYDGDITGEVVVTGSVQHTVLGSYHLRYNVSDSSGNAAEEKARTVNVVDTTAPLISLLGQNPVTLECGVPYVEPGYTATDNFDGDITDVVVVTGSVDHTTAGTYLLTYNVSDSSRNPAQEKTRTVNVERCFPIITLMGNNPLWLEVYNPYREPGYEATDPLDGDVTDKVVVTGTVVENVLGDYVLRYDAQNSSGESAEPKFRTVKVVDSTPPEISLLGENPLALKVGTPYLEPGCTATDNFDGDMTGNVVVSGSVDHTVPGSYSLRYNVVDSSGNPAEQKIRTVNVTFYIQEIKAPISDMVLLTWISRPGSNYTIWSCSDLSKGQWSEEATVTSQGESTTWMDTRATSAVRFYTIEFR